MTLEEEMQKKIKVKVIRIGESKDAFEFFDAPIVPITKEEEQSIKDSAKIALDEMNNFLKE